MNHANPGRRSFGRGLLSAVAVLALVQLMALSGCNSGKRNEAVPGTGPVVDPGACQAGAAFLLSSSTSSGCVGQDIMLNGLNFSPNLANNMVKFSDSSGSFSIDALVTQFIDNGIHPVFGCPDTSIIVKIPTGARSGFITLSVRGSTGTVTDAGLVSYLGCPELVTFGTGLNGVPFLSVDAGFTLLNNEIQVFGFNLDSVTDVEVTDPSGAAITGSTVTQGGVATPNYTVPDTLDVVTVTLNPPGTIIPTCDTYYLKIALVDSSGGVPNSSNAIIVPVRLQFAPNEFAEMPGTITGCVIPSGARRGVIPIQYNLAMDPAAARYDVIPEFLDPATGTWAECEGVADDEGVRTLSGVIGMTSEFGAIIGGGQSNVFNWDTVANGLVYDPNFNNEPVTTKVRFRIENVFPVSVQICDTASQPGAHFESNFILIDNRFDLAAVPPVAIDNEGMVAEAFNSNVQENMTTGNTALWNDGSSGVLSGAAPTGQFPWGSGASDVLCSDVSQFSSFPGIYVFNTNSGSITDISDAASPIPIHDPQPGDPIGTFVLRTLVIEPNAEIQIEGDNPVQILLSGDGDPNTVVCQLHGSINLDGQAGGDAAMATPGDGGAAGPGGGAGGIGGTVDANVGNGMVNFDVPAGRGENQGGYPGANVTYVKEGEPSSAKAGPGGGGGCLNMGADGDTSFSPTFELGHPGRGGPARGGTTLIDPIGGSGGGGGGGNVFRQNSAANIRVDAGGGGGGGGGAIEFTMNGSALITGTISANGGDGGGGATLHSGPGGGGSGGTVRFSATGNIDIADSALITANGGLGATTANQEAGDGSPGRVRLEANGTVNFPSIGDFTRLMPGLGGTITAGKAAPGAVNGGTSVDGVLDFGLFGSGVYVLDTDAGTIAGPIAVPATESEAAYRAAALSAPVIKMRTEAIEWNFTNLMIPSGVSVRCLGDQPAILRVSGECFIDGDGTTPSISVAGFAGGTPDVLTDPTAPTGGVGGAGGPAAGDGGTGGFANSDTDFMHATDSPLDFLPAHLVAGPPFGGGGGAGDPLPPGDTDAAEGGMSNLVAGDTLPAGSGGGGGYGGVGAAGVGGLSGVGGGTFGTKFFTDPVIPGLMFPYGGAGGAGGGGHVDADVAEAFDHAAGSGGGGGGGFLQIAVVGTLNVTASAVIHARGGGSFEAPIKGGNGGSGAGGGVFVQCDGIAVFEGAVNVLGGEANMTPAGVSYAPNNIDTAGPGGSGRVRIETILGFVDQSELQISPAPSVGAFRGGSGDRSYAVSQPYSVLAGNGARFSSPPTFMSPNVMIQPPLIAGSDYLITFEGARESTTNPGQPGEFEGGVSSPSLLDSPDYIRTTWHVYTNRNTSQSVAIDGLELLFQYD